MKIVCPKCGSDQISANQKGFSAGNAIGGAILFGGIGLLAGTAGSKDVNITCLACGNRFKAGKGKIVYDKIDFETQENNRLSVVDQTILHTIKTRGSFPAIRKTSEIKNISMSQAKTYVNELKLKNNPKTEISPGGKTFLKAFKYVLISIGAFIVLMIIASIIIMLVSKK